MSCVGGRIRAEVLDLWFAGLNVWDDKLLDVSDVVEPQKSQYAPIAVTSSYLYNNTTKKRSYYIAPMKITGVPFHFWRSLVEKAGYKISDIPNTWDAFLDFFKPGARQTACARDAQHLRLRLSVNRERRRPDRHLQRLDDRAWWQGPGN